MGCLIFEIWGIGVHHEVTKGTKHGDGRSAPTVRGYNDRVGMGAHPYEEEGCAKQTLFRKTNPFSGQAGVEICRWESQKRTQVEGGSVGCDGGNGAD